jgi:dTDP-4-amino-4,6-dideoxygalactose transaminase
MTTIEGGAISGGSAAEIRAIELHRWHGQVKSGLDGFDTLLAGGKYNLSDVAAAVGLGQLRRLEEFNARRRALVARYYELWGADAPLRLPERGDDGHSWHVFTPLLPLEEVTISRTQFMEAMKARGIGVGVHYPAIHLFSAYRALGYRAGQFPNAERIGRETVTLPLFPAMQMQDVERVVEAAGAVVRGARA